MSGKVLSDANLYFIFAQWGHLNNQCILAQFRGMPITVYLYLCDVIGILEICWDGYIKPLLLNENSSKAF